jgi:hypothetical protein
MKTDTRRVTVTLPVKTLAAVQRIARFRQVTQSVVAAELLGEWLRAKKQASQRARRNRQILRAYREAYRPTEPLGPKGRPD